jgi:hypothetical protein
MAVAVDETWFLSQFPDAAKLRVVSRGRGWGDSPLRFDQASFPVAVEAGAGATVPLIVLTYTSGVGTSPSGVGTSPSGVGTSPSIWIDRTYGGVSRREADAYEDMLSEWYESGEVGQSLAGSQWESAGVLQDAVESYFDFAPLEIAEPVHSYGATLEAAGHGIVPATSP